MNFKKIIATAVLSASIFTCGAADFITDSPSVAHAYYHSDEELLEAIILDAIVEAERERRTDRMIEREQERLMDELMALENCKSYNSYDNYYDYDNYYGYY